MQTEYNRSKDYRQKFIRMHPPDKHGKYRCVYCGKRIKKDEMQVDHVIPVGAMRRHRLLRTHLKGGVNDISNLVPSCRKCNLKKSSKTWLHYRIRARLGSHEGYWAFRKILRIVVILFVCFAIYYAINNPAAAWKLWNVCKTQIWILAHTVLESVKGYLLKGYL